MTPLLWFLVVVGIVSLLVVGYLVWQAPLIEEVRKPHALDSSAGKPPKD